MPEHPTVLVLARAVPGSEVGELLTGVATEVARLGGRVVAVRTHGAPGTGGATAGRGPAPLTAPVAWAHAAGVIVLPGAIEGRHLDALVANGRPVVLAGYADPDHRAPSVVPDRGGGAAMAIDHLLGHGRRRIGFVGDLADPAVAERHIAAQAAMSRRGLTLAPVLDVPTRTESDGRAAAKVVLATAELPDALLVGHDRAAHGLLAGFAEAGVGVPDDVAVIGFGNLDTNAFSAPSLSSVGEQLVSVGAIAARLLLGRIQGTQVPGEPIGRAELVLAARGSCGCTADLFGEQVQVARVRGVAADDLRAELRAMLGAALGGGGSAGVDPHLVSQTLAEVDALLDGPGLGSALAMRRVMTLLHRTVREPFALHQIASAITEYVQRSVDELASAPGELPAPKAARISGGLWQLQAAAYLGRQQQLEVAIREQFEVAFTLLDRSGADPRRLAWLARTRVRAGILALWQGDGPDRRLTVVGTYDASGAAPTPTGPVPVDAFPPAEVLQLARTELGEACFVLPVRNETGDWGLLALVGPIDTSSSREAFHHWAMLLCSVFEAEQRDRAVADSERRYAEVAHAANDGLWEWDPAADEVHVSERGRVLIGLPERPTHGRDDVAGAFDPQDVPAVTAALRRSRSQAGVPVEVEARRRGDQQWLLVRALGVADGSGEVVRVVGSLTDIHRRRCLEDELRRGALVDPVTDLANRRDFLERLSWAVAQSAREPAWTFAVAFLDLDGFKLVNDSLGHLAGDRLLGVIADRLRAGLRSADSLARFGGDEFAVLLHSVEPDEVLAAVHRLQAGLAAPVHLDGYEVALTASVGIAMSQTGYACAEDVLRDADLAMYHAKAVARGSASMFDAQMHREATARLHAHAEVRTALSDGQLVVHYQPIVDLRDGGRVSAFEALVRWNHPQRGLLPPDQFLPAIEETRATVAMGRWVLDEVCRQLAAWRSTGTRAVRVAVNLSHAEFWADGLVDGVARTLDRHGVPASDLVLEITETVVMQDAPAGVAIMHRLRELGVVLHVDDFGTGHSSLQSLRTFPVDVLKLDGSFVRDLGVVAQSTDLVRIILEMSRALGMGVVAECVETHDQADLLVAMGCRSAQGWLFSAAVPAEEAGRLIGCRLLPARPVAGHGPPAIRIADLVGDPAPGRGRRLFGVEPGVRSGA